MAWIVVRSILFGLLGLVAAPIVVFFLVLALGYAFDSRCGTPGDSGGCEMGAASIAIVSTIPGLAIGFAWSLALGLRNRGKS